MNKKIIGITTVILLYVIAGLMLLFKVQRIKHERNLVELSADSSLQEKTIKQIQATNKKLNPYTKENKKASQFFTDFFSELYADHYSGIRVKAYDYTTEALKKENAYDEKWFFVEVKKTLKYQSVDELPFVQGMTAYLKAASPSLQKIYEKKCAELSVYIGRVQFEYNCLKVKIDRQGNFRADTVSTYTYHDAQDVHDFALPSIAEMQQAGKAFLVKAETVKKKRISYNNAKAVSYAYRYSSNPAFAESDSSVWNKEYAAYENDCANFVSQCLYAGGIKKTNTWCDDSLLWIRTGSPRTQSAGLTTYMQRNDAFLSVDYSAVSAGGFICLNAESHVMLVSSNDSITILYNGHTNDRASFCFPHVSSNEAQYLTPNNL